MIPSGALLIDKPPELTSSDVVTQLKWKLVNSGYAPKGFKIGHGGTLDPFATGVLVVLLGEGTKLADTYLHSVKTYDGIITLGVQTNTGDVTGTPLPDLNPTPFVPKLSSAAWQVFADVFTAKDYWQIPPMFSAKKKDGVALHELARAGKTIDREACLKKIHEFRVFTTAVASELSFTVKCEGGTYVRVIAEDLAKQAGTSAHLKTLRRIHASDVQFADCETLVETLRALDAKTPLDRLQNFRPLSNLAGHVGKIEISARSQESLFKGNASETERLCLQLAHELPNEHYVVARHDGIPTALFEKLKDSKNFRLQRVFNEGRRPA